LHAAPESMRAQTVDDYEALLPWNIALPTS